MLLVNEACDELLKRLLYPICIMMKLLSAVSTPTLISSQESPHSLHCHCGCTYGRSVAGGDDTAKRSRLEKLWACALLKIQLEKPIRVLRYSRYPTRSTVLWLATPYSR